MKIQAKIKIILFLMVSILLMMSINIYAASISVSPSKKSVSPGETFTVNVSASGATGKVSVSASNGTVSSSSLWLEPSGSVNVTAGSSGNVTINVKAVDMSDDAGSETSPSGSATVSIVVPQSETPTPTPAPVQAKSNNANLSNLGITPYDFSGFRAANTSYSVSVPYDASSVRIYATAQHSKAKISGTGNKNLNVGSNKFNVVVTAEDGTTKTYTLNITRKNQAVTEKPTQENPTQEKPTEVTVDTPKSSDALLKTLAIEEGSILPEFDPNIKEYTLRVSEDIEKIHIIATPNNENAKVQNEGEKELQLGENIISIEVTAEDGTTEIYTINVTKKNEKIGLKNLSVGYIDENGTLVALQISPEFNEDVLEYTIDNLEHSIDKLEINAIPLEENFEVEVIGNEKLEDGRNVITIITRKVSETEEVKKTEYKLVVNRKLAPKVGIMGKTKNAFISCIKSIKKYVNDNKEKLIVLSLTFCSVAMFVLSIYIIFDYRRYKMMLEKLRKLVKENSNMSIEAQYNENKSTDEISK